MDRRDFARKLLLGSIGTAVVGVWGCSDVFDNSFFDSFTGKDLKSKIRYYLEKSNNCRYEEYKHILGNIDVSY